MPSLDTGVTDQTAGKSHHVPEIRMREPAQIHNARTGGDAAGQRPQAAECCTDIGSDADDLDRSFGVAAGALLAAVAVMALAAVFWPA